MYIDSWRDLQLFAEGDGASAGDSGASAAPAVETASAPQTADPAGAADQGALRARGFSEAQIQKIQKYQASRAKAAPEPVVNQEPAPEAQQPATAKEASPAESEAPKRSLKELLAADPDLNKQAQAMMQKRLKSTNGKAENFDKMTRAFQVLAKKYNMDPNNMDYDKLGEAIAGDDDNIAEEIRSRSVELGLDYETTAGIVRQEQELQWMHDQEAERKRQEEITLEQRMNDDHIQKLIQQGAELQKKYPGFDLRTEMQNPAFQRMTSPQLNIPIETAYRAIHPEIDTEIRNQAYEDARSQITKSIQAGARRPTESGTSGVAPSVTSFNYSTASKAQREQFKAELRRAWGRGETVRPTRG